MASIHVWKAMEKAAQKGGYAGRKDSGPLWDLSKRELVEIAARLGEMCSEAGGAEGGIARALEEHRILKENKIV
jgi:DNA invertase Pin-like site-specific DNA recombinase